VIPFIDRMVRVSLRTITTDVPSQDVITRDNGSVKVNAVIFFRVLDAAKAVISVQDYLYATSQMAQTTAAERAGPAGSGRPPGLAREDQPGGQACPQKLGRPRGLSGAEPSTSCSIVGVSKDGFVWHLGVLDTNASDGALTGRGRDVRHLPAGEAPPSRGCLFALYFA
jgi:hypothetical protein